MLKCDKLACVGQRMRKYEYLYEVCENDDDANTSTKTFDCINGCV